MDQELSDKDKAKKALMVRQLAGLEKTWLPRGRQMLAMLPSDPRCTLCMSPFEGWGGIFSERVLNKRRSEINPLFCNYCEREAKRLKISANIEMSMVFADIRNSTPLAESMGALEFSRMIDRFYTETTHVLVHSYAVIDKLAGDQVSGYYLPGMVGNDFARIAVKAAQDLLRATGYGGAETPWVPVGAGVNTGETIFGFVGSSGGKMEITALGDAANVAARLASNAAAGEILLSESTVQMAGIETGDLEKRKLELKGKRESQDVWVMRV